MSIGEVWEQYKKKRDGDYFTDNVSFVFVPTASGARGYDAVRQFLSTAYDSRTISVKEKVVIQTIGQNSIVEESDTTITFVSGDGAWLAPGVDSRFTIDSHVVIPTITSASFEGDRISSIRVYWDQASTLKQLKLISKDSWPIVGERQVDAIRNISSAHLNPFGKTGRLAAGVAKINLDQQQERPSPGRQPVHTSSRVNQPGGTGGRSTIFDDMSDDGAQRFKRTSGRVNQPSSLFGDSETYDAQRDRFNSNKNTSQSSIGNTGEDDSRQDTPATEQNVEQQEGPPPGRRPVHTSSRVSQPGGTGGRSTIFDDMSDPHEDGAQRFKRTSGRVNQPSSLFGDSGTYDENAQHEQQEGLPPGRRPIHTSSRVNKPGGTGGRSTIFDDMSDPHEDGAQRFKRTSGRVIQPSPLFGGSETYDDNAQHEQQEGLPPGRRPIHTSSRVNQPGGTGGRSSIFDDMSDPREDVSSAQRGRFNSNKNASQFSIGNTGEDDSRQDTSSISGSSRRRGKSQFESSLEFGDDGGSQPPQRSSVKPSSRVLRPPGGGSSFTFGE